MTKKTISYCIAYIPIKFEVKVKDLIEKHGLHPDDTITVSYDDDGELACYVYRDREETDEEYKKRIQSENFANENLKQKRYATYLKLKEEFENE